MYKYLTALCVIASSIGAYASIDMKEFAKFHPSGFGIQIAGGGIDLAYYADNHSYIVALGSATYNNEKKDSVASSVTTTTKEVGFSTSVYFRKNFPLTERSTYGIGISAGKEFPTSDDTRGIKKSYQASQYLSIEYAVSNKLFLYGSIKPFKVKYIKTTDGNTDGDNTNNMYLLAGGSVQLTYLM